MVKHLQEGCDKGSSSTVPAKKIVKQAKVEVPDIAMPNTDLKITIFEKDSKRYYQYSTKDQSVSHGEVFADSNYPHNFQSCQINSNQVYVVGGGDFNVLPDSMFSLRRFIVAQSGSARLEEKAKLKYARHGHSVCAFADRFLVVTGSRKDISRAPFRTEVYDSVSDTWMEAGLLV